MKVSVTVAGRVTVACATSRTFALAMAFAVLVTLPLAAGGAADATGLAASTATVSTLSVADYPVGYSGDYVVYRDWSWKEPTYTGFLYYDESTWGAFVKSPSTGVDVSILFRAEILDGRMVLVGQKIISTITQKDVETVNYLMGLLPDMYKWRKEASFAATSSSRLSAVSGRSDLLPAVEIHERSIASFGGEVALVWAPEVPVFNLQTMTGKDGSMRLELVRAGRVQGEGDAAFFGFLPVPATGYIKAGAKFSPDPKRTPDVRELDGVSVNLDSQWKMLADNTFLLGDSAILIVDTLDLALMQVPSENLPLSLVRLFSLSSGISSVLPASFFLSGNSTALRISNSVYDIESGSLNRDIKYCVVSTDRKKCTVVSLTVNETAYVANREYFDTLF